MMGNCATYTHIVESPHEMSGKSPQLLVHVLHHNTVLLVLDKSSVRAELNHFFHVLSDFWKALQHLLKVIPGQREALTVGQSLHCGQMFAFGQEARFCYTHRGRHKSVVNEQVNSNDRDEI